MSRGPGKRQRAILAALEDHPEGFVLAHPRCPDARLSHREYRHHAGCLRAVSITRSDAGSSGCARAEHRRRQYSSVETAKMTRRT